MIFFHFAFLWAPGKLSFPRLPRTTPKYLEYVYILCISFCLVQIHTFPGNFLPWLNFVYGDESTILGHIKSEAKAEQSNCGQTNSKFFTSSYCDDLAKILSVDGARAMVDLSAHIDGLLQSHQIGERSMSTFEKFTHADRDSDFVPIYSPLAEYSYELRTMRNFAGYKAPRTDYDLVFKWISILLLPVGIALRATKTSLELGQMSREAARTAAAGA